MLGHFTRTQGSMLGSTDFSRLDYTNSVHIPWACLRQPQQPLYSWYLCIHFS